MKQQSIQRFKFALWLVVALVLVGLSAGTLFAAGEQLKRGAVVSGGGTISSNGMTLRSTVELPVAGALIASSSGQGLCSGFTCGTHANTSPDDPDDPNPDPDPDPDSDVMIFMPMIETQ